MNNGQSCIHDTVPLAETETVKESHFFVSKKPRKWIGWVEKEEVVSM